MKHVHKVIELVEELKLDKKEKILLGEFKSILARATELDRLLTLYCHYLNIDIDKE